MTLSAETGDDIVIIRSEAGLEPKGNGLRLIIKDTIEAVPNTQLVPVLAEAFKLRDTLLSGPHDSIEAMSKALQLGKGYLTSRIRLTFLSPVLIKKIFAGDVSATLSPTRLLEASKQLPAKWAEQDHYFTALSR